MKIRHAGFYCCFLVIGLTAWSQGSSTIENIIGSYPSSFSTPEKLAERIMRDFTTPEEKARAVFVWIAHHITYDLKTASRSAKMISFSYATAEERVRKEQEIEHSLALRTLRRKKAVCQGYATLYKQVCQSLGIECQIISGTAKIYESDIGKLPGVANHAWNVVKINGDWKLVDVTWGAGYMDGTTGRYVPEYDDVYFNTAPEIFFLNHYPRDPRWLFTPMTPEQFAALPLYYPAALRSAITIEEPQTGLVTLPVKNYLKVILRNYPSGTFTFSLNGRQYPESLTPKRAKGLSVFTLKVNRPGLLTLYINGEAFMGYRLVR